MPTKKNNNNYYFGWSKPAVIGSVIAIIAILAIGLTSFYMGKNQSGGKSPIPVIDLSQSNQQRVLGSQMFNLNGTVVAIEDSGEGIIFSTQFRDDSQVMQTKEVSVTIDNDTQLLQWDVTRPSNEDPNAVRTPLTFGDIAPGQRITVQTSDDVEEKIQFLHP